MGSEPQMLARPLGNHRYPLTLLIFSTTRMLMPLGIDENLPNGVKGEFSTSQGRLVRRIRNN